MRGSATAGTPNEAAMLFCLAALVPESSSSALPPRFCNTRATESPGVEMSAGSAAGDGQCQFGHHSSSLRFRYWRNQGRKESFARIEF